MKEQNAHILYKNNAVIHGIVMTLFPPTENGDTHLIVTTTCLVKTKEIKVDHRILIRRETLDGRHKPAQGHYIAVEGPLTEHGYVIADAYYNATDSLNGTARPSTMEFKNYIVLYGTIESPPQPFRTGYLFTVKTHINNGNGDISATHLVLATDSFSQKLNGLANGVYVWLEGPLSIDKKVILSHLNIMSPQPLNHHNKSPMQPIAGR